MRVRGFQGISFLLSLFFPFCRCSGKGGKGSIGGGAARPGGSVSRVRRAAGSGLVLFFSFLFHDRKMQRPSGSGYVWKSCLAHTVHTSYFIRVTKNGDGAQMDTHGSTKSLQLKHTKNNRSLIFPSLPHSPPTQHSPCSRTPIGAAIPSLPLQLQLKVSSPPYSLPAHAPPSLPPCDGGRAPCTYHGKERPRPLRRRAPRSVALPPGRLPLTERQRRCRLGQRSVAGHLGQW